MKRLVLLAVALGGLSLAAPLPFPKPVGSDIKALQGEWVGVRESLGGKGRHDGEVMSSSVSGTRIAFYLKGERRSAWDFTLDPTKSPKHMDLLEVGSKNA